MALVGMAILNVKALGTLTKMLATHVQAFKAMREAFDALLNTTGHNPIFICPMCGRVSHNPNDVKNRYCGVCGFTDDGPKFKVVKPNA